MSFEEMLEQLMRESQSNAIVGLRSNLEYLELANQSNKTCDEIENYLPEDKKDLFIKYKENIWDKEHHTHQDVAYMQGAYDSVKILKFLKVI